LTPKKTVFGVQFFSNFWGIFLSLAQSWVASKKTTKSGSFDHKFTPPFRV